MILFSKYISIARPSHWVKHIFILPGIIGAIILVGKVDDGFIQRCLLGFSSACLISSANYVINEWLDSMFDIYHPLKCTRPGAEGLLSPTIVVIEYTVLGMIGLALAYMVNTLFFIASITFVVSGICYNIRPMRTKDWPYLDVITEAINNPIRLLLGWAMVSEATIPPLSFVGTYWLGGAFLMAAKRLSEYRFIVDTKGPEAPGQYRRSFRYYTELSLMLSCFVYSIMASFLLSTFLLKYRTELILSFPLFALLFGYYLYMAMQKGSAAQRPEKLHKDKTLIVILLLLVAILGTLSVVDIPQLERLLKSTFTEVNLK